MKRWIVFDLKKMVERFAARHSSSLAPTSAQKQNRHRLGVPEPPNTQTALHRRLHLHAQYAMCKLEVCERMLLLLLLVQGVCTGGLC